MEPVLQTETCSGSKITTGNPNGLSLATLQTAGRAETQTDGRGHGQAPEGMGAS